MDSYNGPFSYLRNYQQRRIKLFVIRDANERLKLIIRRKNSSNLEKAIAGGIILREILQNPHYQESEDK